jgi:ribose-phosphate pyrophosphokinase
MNNTKTTLYLLNRKDEINDIGVIYSAFPDGDTHCVIEETYGIKGAHVLIRHSLYPDQNSQIFKLILLVDLLNELGARSVSVAAPYLPYARQDKRYLPGEAVSATILCKLLYRIGVSHLYTFDCHFMKGRPELIQGRLPITNISLGEALIGAVRKELSNKPFNVVGPDIGSNYLVKEYGSKHMLKERGEYGSLKEGDSYRHVTKLEHEHLTFDNGQALLIIDDMISTGGTIVRAVENMRNHGLKDIYCLTVHGLFLNDSYPKIKRMVKKVISSDTIAHTSSFALVDEAITQQILPDWRMVVANSSHLAKLKS